MSTGYQIFEVYLSTEFVLLGEFDRNRYCRYMMDVVLRIQIKNLASIRCRRSLRLAGVYFLLIFLTAFSSCEENVKSIPDSNFVVLKLYKITFFDGYEIDAVFCIKSEFLIINNTDSCIENIKDVNKLSFIYPIFECKLDRFEYISKGTFDNNSQIVPGDTAFYWLTHTFVDKNIAGYSRILVNPEKYLALYNQREYSEGPIRIIVHPSVKIYHSTSFHQNRKYPLPFHEEIEYDDMRLDKTQYEFLRFKYDNFYNK